VKPKASRRCNGNRGLGLAAALLALAGCGRTPTSLVPAENRLVIALESAPAHLDPRIATDQVSDRLFDLTQCGLVAKGPQGDLVPSLARSWEILDGGRRYRFRLRTDATFHDGRPVTAEDAAATYRSLLDGSVVSSKRAALAAIEALEVLPPDGLEIRLREPAGAFLIELTSSLGVLPRGLEPAAVNRAPIGCGAFRVVERTPERLVLAPHAGFFGGRPGLDEVVLKVVPDSTVRALELLKGSVHLVVNDLPPDLVPRFRQDPRFAVVEEPGGNYAYVGFNLGNELTANPRVRRAFALAIDRERLVATLWRGLGAVTDTMMPPGSWARNDALPRLPYDPEQAARLLEEAGYSDPDGPGPAPRIRLTLKTSASEIINLQAQAIQQMVAAAGIAVEVRSLEFATFFSDIARGNFQAFTLIRTAIADPNIYRITLHSQSVPPSGQNRGRYQNPAFDRLIELGGSLTERADRRPHYLEAQRILAEDLPYASLFVRKNFAIFPRGLEGYECYMGGELLGIKDLRWRRGS
jgi:peptide/nickel transport system substrate-binding protein